MNILSFDSLHIIKPLRIVYLYLINFFLKLNKSSKHKILLYRLDQDNIFIRKDNNLSGDKIGVHQNKIDAASIKFYRHLENLTDIKKISIKNHSLYDLHTRQVKLKLAGVLACAYRINNFAYQYKQDIEIVTDYQTASIMQEAFVFLGINTSKISWKKNYLLTIIISLNSLLMRLASLLVMHASKSMLPQEYFIKNVKSDFPTALIALPRRRPEDFYKHILSNLKKI